MGPTSSPIHIYHQDESTRTTTVGSCRTAFHEKTTPLKDMKRSSHGDSHGAAVEPDTMIKMETHGGMEANGGAVKLEHPSSATSSVNEAPAMHAMAPAMHHNHQGPHETLPPPPEDAPDHEAAAEAEDTADGASKRSAAAALGVLATAAAAAAADDEAYDDAAEVDSPAGRRLAMADPRNDNSHWEEALGPDDGGQEGWQEEQLEDEQPQRRRRRAKKARSPMATEEEPLEMEQYGEEDDGHGYDDLSKGGALRVSACQVPGCTEPNDHKLYYRRYRICQKHLMAPSIVVDGLECRFCQQCARFQPLTEFDGARRSCRIRLMQHTTRRRNNRMRARTEAKAAAAAATAVGSEPGRGYGMSKHRSGSESTLQDNHEMMHEPPPPPSRGPGRRPNRLPSGSLHEAYSSPRAMAADNKRRKVVLQLQDGPGEQELEREEHLGLSLGGPVRKQGHALYLNEVGGSTASGNSGGGVAGRGNGGRGSPYVASTPKAGISANGAATGNASDAVHMLLQQLREQAAQAQPMMLHQQVAGLGHAELQLLTNTLALAQAQEEQQRQLQAGLLQHQLLQRLQQQHQQQQQQQQQQGLMLSPQQLQALGAAMPGAANQQMVLSLNMPDGQPQVVYLNDSTAMQLAGMQAQLHPSVLQLQPEAGANQAALSHLLNSAALQSGMQMTPSTMQQLAMALSAPQQRRPGQQMMLHQGGLNIPIIGAPTSNRTSSNSGGSTNTGAAAAAAAAAASQAAAASLRLPQSALIATSGGLPTMSMQQNAMNMQQNAMHMQQNANNLLLQLQGQAQGMGQLMLGQHASVMQGAGGGVAGPSNLLTNNLALQALQQQAQQVMVIPGNGIGGQQLVVLSGMNGAASLLHGLQQQQQQQQQQQGGQHAAPAQE